MNVAIIGSRNLNPKINLTFTPTSIISGGAKGVDQAAKHYARANNIVFVEYLPDYKKHGRGAPLIRNKQIIDEADRVVAFWDGKSRGTLFGIEYAKKRNKPVEVFIIQNNE